ncbi:hypothetical protein BDM02DRAFT_2012525 [Thelephora ganbajun]|uniref:Uncharacterized protein n=1 Tax=Thelephora ganbajun TaxID=370292 RepID=A0ACB6ZH67_THEGA|nr:hypothetical protein BDM02DRAFT_2012525 [Thelephora ganbajun]
MGRTWVRGFNPSINQCAVFSRNSPDPTVGHYNVSHGEYPDQWFTLLHGSGKYAGRYAVKGQVSGNVLFSRNQSPTVGHIGGDGQYEDNWFKIEPGSGQYANYFRLITPVEGLTLFSRSSLDPTFGNHTEKNFYADQLFGFFWEDMKVDKIEYNLDAGKIISSTPIALAEQVLTNNSDSEQEMSFSVNKGVTNSSTFEYSTGFTVTVGMEFSVGVPFIAEGKMKVEASTTNTWTWGKTTEYTTQYTANFPVKAGPHKSVRASSVVNQGTLDVPYIIFMSSKSAGVKVETKGTWRGVSSWDLRHTITALN